MSLKFSRVRPGDPKRGSAIAAGELAFCGILVHNPELRWFPPAASEEWHAAWHGFDWLSDLVAAGPAARDKARGLVQSWLTEQAKFPRSVAWRADVMGTRLFAWLAHFDEIAGAGAEPSLTRALLASLAKQRRQLWRAALREIKGAPRLRALKGLVAASLVLNGAARPTTKALSALERELAAQILADGGHCSRSPSVQLHVLLDLIEIRTMLRAAAINPPPGLTDAIERGAPMLRLFRYGDRRLGLFNNSIEEDGVLIDVVLTQSETRGRALTHARDTGFERLQANKSLVVVDTGNRASSAFEQDAHAGALSFEMSHGRDRIIVNCGAYRGPKSKWSEVLRASAAHSVLVVADTNSSPIRQDGALNRTPMSVTCERAEHEGQQWISVSHNGYRDRFGLVYQRELFLTADGDDLRGEDRLVGRPGASFAVRFHLHPAVQPALAEGENAVVLTLPSSCRWRLRAVGAQMSLAESVYFGSGAARKTQQVVLSGTAEPGGTTVRWAMRRERDTGAAD